jgi:crotonobetainyl-CoA:carnitine CoA-transferase CaiB-like acyl-CoA transferase
LAANGERAYDMGRRILGGGAPNYRTYECADGRYIAVGPIEPKFHAILREKLGLEMHAAAGLANGDSAAAETHALEAAFKQRTRDEWTALLQDSDACFAPVMAFDEAPSHPHVRERGAYVEIEGVVQPAVAPRFSRTPGAIRRRDPEPDGGGRAALRRWGAEP